MRKIQIAFITFTAIITQQSCDITGDCSNHVAAEIASPNQNYKIVEFDRGCGATTGNSIQLSVIKSTDSLPDDAGNIFIADSTIRNKCVLASWINDKTILVKHNDNLRIFKKDSLVAGFKIIYELMQPEE